jgi:hypothetical protein
MAGTTYCAGVWTQDPSQRGFNIRATAELSEADYESISSDAQTFQTLLQRQTYELTHVNRAALLGIRDAYASIDLLHGDFRGIDLRSVSKLMTGSLANWLASVRMYLESERDFILREFGTSSEQMARYKGVTGYAFDTYPGYRFTYNLRDYTQHCGIPPGSLEISADDAGRRRIELILDRTALLNSRFSWSSHANRLLNSWPDRVLLMPLIEETHEGLAHIERGLKLILLERCGEAIPRLRDALALVGDAEGYPAVFQMPDGGDGDLGYASLPPLEALAEVEAALAEDDPVGAVVMPIPPPPTVSAGQASADSHARAVLRVWLDHGPGPQVEEAINAVLDKPEGLTVLVSGLINFSAQLLMIHSRAFGSDPAVVLGEFEDVRSLPADESPE